MKKSLKILAVLLSAMLLFTFFAISGIAESTEPDITEISLEPVSEETSEETSEIIEESSEESSEEISDETTEETTEEISDETTEETTEEISDETSEESSGESSEESSDETSEESSDETSSDTSDETTSEPPVNALKLNITTKNIVSVKVVVNGYEVDYTAYAFEEGDEITMTFDVGGTFLSHRADLTVNGSDVDLTSDTYSFTMNSDTEINIVYNVVAVKFTINGPGTLVLLDQNDERMEISNGTAGSYEEIIMLDTRTTYRLKVVPAMNYEVRGLVNFSTGDLVFDGEIYHFRFARNGTAVIDIVPATTPDLPSEYSANINIGAGGVVSANGQSYNPGDAEVKIPEGNSLELTVTPNNGYEIDAVIVNGSVVELEDNKYTVSDVKANIRVQVLFKTIETETVEGISVDDVDWNAQPIRIDVTGGKKVLLEVFKNIAKLPAEEGKYVEFVSENAIVYIPYGKACVGSSSAIDMSVKAINSGEVLQSIKTSTEKYNSSSVAYKVFAFDINLILPDGAFVSFKLGSDYVKGTVVPVLFDVTNSNFSRKDEIGVTYSVSAEGISEKIPYDNEKLLIVSKEYLVKHKVVSSLSGSGTITPSGVTEITDGGKQVYEIKAKEGFVIKKILINDQMLAEVSGLKVYSYTFENVISSNTIHVEFEIEEVKAPEVSQPATDNTQEPKTDMSTVIAIIVIAFVAIAGAAALFIVKWRQEKF